MTIERGSDWGTNDPLPPGAPTADGDSELRGHIESHRRKGSAIPPIGLLGGDLWRTLGAPTGGVERLRGDLARTVPIDIASVLLDGRQFWFASHLVARRSWWRGRVFVALNAEWLGDWDLGPRAHPNDGRLDLYETDMALTQRIKARGRLGHGGHLPHPDITSRRVQAHQTTFEPATNVWLDGSEVGRAEHLTLRVEPDALMVTV